MGRRRWSEAELEVLRRGYGHVPTARLAEQLDRSEKAVGIAASVCGLTRRRIMPEGLLEFIRARHAAGLLDTEIQAGWNAEHPDATVCRKTVAYHRRKMGLATNETRLAEKRRAGYRRQLETLRITSLAVLAQRRQRRPAVEAGLPTDLRPLEVRVFQVLRRGGYWTRAEIARECGYQRCDRTAQREWFKCKYGSQSALSNLVNRGLVRRTVGRTRRRGGKGNTAYEYWVPLDVLQRWQPRSKIA